jgi:hypothetical protein
LYQFYISERKDEVFASFKKNKNMYQLLDVRIGIIKNNKTIHKTK